jgi:hypothetical protein
MAQIPDIRDAKPWRYLPDSLMTERGLSLVVRTVFVPPKARTPKDFPIISELGVLACDCANGEKRFFGFADARINSKLRMVVRLSDFHMRDEVIRKWEPERED